MGACATYAYRCVYFIEKFIDNRPTNLEREQIKVIETIKRY